MWGQDRAYAALMRELWGSPDRWNVRRTYVDLARKLGVDEETVRNRINRLKGSGFLLGWRLGPNPMLLGRRSAFLLLELEDAASKENAITRLSSSEGVVIITSFYGKNLLVTLYDDAEATSSKGILGSGIGREALILPGMGFPPSALRMTVTDWRIVSLLLKNAETKATEVAAAVGVSARTIKRRLNEMMDASAIFILPQVDLRKAGGVPYHLVIQAEERRTADVDRLVASRIDNLVFRAAGAGGTLIFGFTGANVAEGSEILTWVQQQAGVRSARMNIVERVIHVFDWLEGEVARRLTTK